MPSHHIPRRLESVAVEVARGYPAVVITGPRQSGKTTLARACFGDRPYVTFEDPLVQQRLHSDPHGFLAAYHDGAVFDEAQHVPTLFSYLQGLIDTDGRMGRFVLTGSQQLGMVEKITQSLAGRVAMLELLPFDHEELRAVGAAPTRLDQAVFAGSYPPIYDRAVAPARWYGDYVATYLQRDVRQILRIHNLSAFTTFLRLCAGHVGQLVNTSQWGAACGVDHKTITGWLSVLEASYVAFRLQPHHENFKKRLIKTPKLYFYDTGLAAHLVGITDEHQIATHPLRGALVENWVIAELYKHAVHNGDRPKFYFWRSQSGLEVDLLIERGARLLPVEVKSGRSVHPETVDSLLAWRTLAGDLATQPCLVYGGTDTGSLRGCTLTPWDRASSVLSS